MIKIGICLDHAEAVAMYEAATGLKRPGIPAGKNTVVVNFRTQDGHEAILVNQRGFAPRASDNEEQINGCTVAVVLDDTPAQDARAALETWMRGMLEV